MNVPTFPPRADSSCRRKWILCAIVGCYVLCFLPQNCEGIQHQQQQQSVIKSAVAIDGGATTVHVTIRVDKTIESENKLSDDPIYVDAKNLSSVLADVDWTYLAQSYGMPQRLDAKFEHLVKPRLWETYVYMNQTVYQDDQYKSFRHLCQNKHENCAYWAATGECNKTAAYMLVDCAPACLSCDKIHYETRCAAFLEHSQRKGKPQQTGGVWQQPGDLHRTFESIVERFSTVVAGNTTTTETFSEENQEQPKPKLTVLGRPTSKNLSTGDSNITPNSDINNKKRKKEKKYDSDDLPWILTIDHFLTDDECDNLISLGIGKGYEQSTNTGRMNPDGTLSGHLSSGRTSSNTWCTEDCFQNAIVQRVLRKLEGITGIPDTNSEFLQLLQYQEGQFYERHHDYIHFHLQRPQGPRIMTVYLYLNDVEAGGGTHFTRLNVTVMPQKGRALLWPSVLNDDPYKIDLRTEHKALPVERGVKYGANAWVHQRDFKIPFEHGCT